MADSHPARHSGSVPIFPENRFPAILIVKADRLCGEMLRRVARSTFPNAAIHVTDSIGAAAAVLSTDHVDLLVSGIRFGGGADILEFLANCVQVHRIRRVLVVARHLDDHVLGTLRSIHIPGLFDPASEEPSQLRVALRALMDDKTYWTNAVLERMRLRRNQATPLMQRLTVLERLVLALVGDGRDDVTAARAIFLSPSTIATVRRELHRKLGVQHRGDLIRVAAEHGFIRFTASGVVRPGFSLLLAAYQPRKNPTPVAPEDSTDGVRARVAAVFS